MAVATANTRTTLTRLRRRPPRVGTAIETPQLSVVIVNFCQWKNTARLTRQLRRCEAIRRGAAEIVIVDNHSPEQKIAQKLLKLSGVTVFQNAANEGFARAVNRGSNLSHGEWVLLLNPDVTVPEGFLDSVLDSAQRWPAIDAKAGVVGFQLRNRDGTRQASAGVFPTLMSTLGRLFLPRSRRKCSHQSLEQRSPVPWVTGGCLLVRRDCYEELHGLDEKFFLYYEDVDFCQRARTAGWSIWYDPELEVTHHWPLHVREVPPALRLVTRHALLTYARKHWSRWQAAALNHVVRLEAKAREKLANYRGETDAAQWYTTMNQMTRDLAHDRTDAVAEHIRQAAATLHEIAAAQDGRTT
jgi:N-acetylglucosaminyl-diphospho-decaprenol L-rhamnosyltransferase